MKFSERKKAKMRKARQKRINKLYKDPVGVTVDWKEGYKCVDYLKVDDIFYLLAKNADDKYAIYKIIDVHQYTKLNSNQIFKMASILLKDENWHCETSVLIMTDNMGEAVVLAEGKRNFIV